MRDSPQVEDSATYVVSVEIIMPIRSRPPHVHLCADHIVVPTDLQYFARPSYQNSAVSTYLEALGDTNSGLFNASGRGYPDIAAIGDG